MLEAEHVRRSLLEIQMRGNVVACIQHLCMLMYKILTMTEDEAFLLFMLGNTQCIIELQGCQSQLVRYWIWHKCQ